MAQHINSVPEGVTQAGLDYVYPATPPFVTIVLVNAPLDPDHQHVGLNRAAYDAYIDAQLEATPDPSVPGGAAWVLGEDQVSYDPEYNLKVGLDYDTAIRLYNYGRITAANGRKWYVFYTPIFLNLNVTRFLADIDEFPSFDWVLGYSMVERGHVAVAASQGDTYGDQYLTAPEPIDAPPVRGVLDGSLLGAAPDSWTVLVVSANDLRGGTGFPFWDKHVESDLIAEAAGLASSATVDSSGTVQFTIPEADYPWLAQSNSDTGPATGTPLNGYVPSAYRADLVDGPPTKDPTPPGIVQAETNTAAAWALLKADHPEASISGPASGYWSRALDRAIHHDPAAYDVIDTGLSPIGASPHGLGIRINIHGVDPSIVEGYGFTEFNSFTYTYNGPYIWDGAPSPTLEAFVPKVEASPVSTIDGIPAGGGVYLFTMRGFAQYMTIMQGAPWVLSGIVDVRLVPSWAVGDGGDAGFSPAVPSLDPSDGMWDAAADIPNFLGEVVSATATPNILEGWRDDVLAAVDAVGWTKLLTAQFTDLLVGNGESLLSFRPDQWHESGVGFIAVTGAAHGDPSIRLIPQGYNDLGSQMGIDAPVGGKAGLAHSGFGLAASNIASQDITPYLNAYSSHSTSASNLRNKELAQTLGYTNIQLNAAVQGIQTILGGAVGAAGGALGDSAKGGAASAALGAVSGLATAAITASNTITMLDISQNGSYDIGGFQLGLSGEAAVVSFDTWMQSLFSQSGNGSAHQIASGWRAILAQAFQVIISVPSVERVRKLVSEWSRYGYMIGQAFAPSQLNTMSKFSYWKTSGALISGTTPQEKRRTIAQAFDRGVTVWTVVADIGTDVTDDNTPLSGISY
jgi:hypothetical protein